ncbi:MAG: right-handed parallel beta-helix repeat-containing protein, partial [Thermoplasmata archaeon]|nr:right-handed parallel beta-helix repeat-containing protein [Thermoplasmata archaeon]
SIPEVVSFGIQTNTSESSTNITMGGFEPNKTYYRHEDGHFEETFAADSNGNYSYTQDLSEPHHVFIQEESSTKMIRDDSTGGDCTLIGNWDSTTKTCTLTVDVYETIIIDSNGVTLDGGGHSVTRGVGSYGVYMSHKSGTTITNVVVDGFTYAIHLAYSISNSVSGNVVSGYYGIRVYRSVLNTISENTASGYTGYYWSTGILLDQANSNSVSGNVVSGHNGLRLSNAHGNTISGNIVSDCANYGIWATFSNSNSLIGNTVSNNAYGIFLYFGENTLRSNVMSGNSYNLDIQGWHPSDLNHDIDTTNTVDGKSVYYWIGRSGETVPSDAGYVGIIDSDNMIVQDLTLTNNGQGIFFAHTYDSTIKNVDVSSNLWGIRMIYSEGNTISGNTVTGYDYGIYPYYSYTNTISGNTVTGNDYGIYLYGSDTNIIGDNILTGNDYGIYLYDYSDSNTISGNTVTDNTYQGIYLQNSDTNTMTVNTVKENMRGIHLENSDSNTISVNEVTDNTYQG